MAIEEIDLYRLKAENLAFYLPGDDCGKCGVRTCALLAKDILEGRGKAIELPFHQTISCGDHRFCG